MPSSAIRTRTFEHASVSSSSTIGSSPRQSLKRTADIMLGASLLLMLFPLLALLTVLVMLTSKGPALFVQKRLGQGRRVFHMFKLRTMHEGAERLEKHELLVGCGKIFFKPRNDPRVTRVGDFLRKYSLDELPQLINVIRGDMSLVGPRPLLVHEMQDVPEPMSGRRFAAKPGITGLWQVNGRSTCTDEQRLLLDLEYVDNWSLQLDLKILIKTLPAVFSAKGAY